MNNVFLFDLDSTVTQEEILPRIARELNKESEMRILTEKTMRGEIPFAESFSSRVEMLQGINVTKVAGIVEKVKLNTEIVQFLMDHHENCYIVTSNLDVWIKKLMLRIGMEDHCFSSIAEVKDDRIVKISHILPKEQALGNFVGKKIIAIGDGSNDKNLISKANIGIGFGGVRPISPVLLGVCDYAIYSETKLCNLLKKIYEESNNDN